MDRLSKLALGTVALIAMSGVAFATDEHHPPAPGGAPPAAAEAPVAPSSPGGMPRGQGGIMMGQGGAGGMPMMGPQGQGSMMQMMGMGDQDDRRMGGMPGGGMIDHMDGRIAFLRAELKITDAQAAPWDAFAKALREDAKTLNEIRGSMMQRAVTTPASLSDRFTMQEKILTARLDGLRSVRAALEKLEAVLTDDQKKAAGELIPMQMRHMM